MGCGGGVIERPENRTLLQEHGQRGGVVCHIVRQKDDVIRYLINEKSRPKYAEEIRTVWQRRFPLYEDCSTHTFYSLTSRRPVRFPTLALKPVETDFLDFVRRITATARNPHLLRPQRRTFCLTLHDLDPSSLDKAAFKLAVVGADALELRIDSLRAHNKATSASLGSPFATPSSHPGYHEPSYIAFAAAQLRRICPLPIIFTLRTTRQQGFFSVEEERGREEYLHLVCSAYRLGVEAVDVEYDVGAPLIYEIAHVKPPSISLILSHTDMSRRLSWESAEVRSMLLTAVNAKADALKLVLTSATSRNADSLAAFRQHCHDHGIAALVYSRGDETNTSYLSNGVLTPISSKHMRNMHDLWILSFSAAQKYLTSHGTLSRKTLFVCTESASRAQSTKRFRAACELLHLPFDVVSADQPLLDAHFGGAITSNFPTRPLPAQISLADDALQSGMANLVLPATSTTSFSCDNAQVSAIARMIEQHLAPINAISELSTAVVYAADAQSTQAYAYALHVMGIAQTLCIRCDASMLSVTSATALSNTAHLVGKQPTIIVACQNPMREDVEVLLSSPTGGTLLDMCGSRSLWSALLNQHRLSDAWVRLSQEDALTAFEDTAFAQLTGVRLSDTEQTTTTALLRPL